MSDLDPDPAPAAPDPRFQIENLHRAADPKPQQKFRRQHCDVIAGSTMDLDEITPPKILDPSQVKWLHSRLRSRNVLCVLAGNVNAARYALRVASRRKLVAKA